MKNQLKINKFYKFIYFYATIDYFLFEKLKK